MINKIKPIGIVPVRNQLKTLFPNSINDYIEMYFLFPYAEKYDLRVKNEE